MENNDTDTIRRIHAVAVQAAREAGELMKSNCGQTKIEKQKSNHQDVVTLVDKMCQDTIEKHIQTNFPDHSLLGEESVPPGAEASAEALEHLINKEWLWVVDPIDGTTNFVHGRPMSVVSIGVAHKGEVVVGIVFDPYRDEMFHAIKGQGALVNDRKINVSDDVSLESSVIGFGIGTSHRVREPTWRGIQEVSSRCRGVRLVGSAALDLAWVACGRLTAWWELDLNSWDIAAGSLLVREAGGTLSDTRGQPFTLRTRDICASNSQAIHRELLNILKSSGADRKLSEESSI